MAKLGVEIGGYKPIEIDMDQVIKNAAGETASEMATDLQNRSTGLFGAGDYSTGWTWKNDSATSAIVFNNGRDRSLAHLLENGHVVANQYGSGYGYVAGKKHINPSFKVFKKRYNERLSKALEAALKNA